MPLTQKSIDFYNTVYNNLLVPKDQVVMPQQQDIPNDLQPEQIGPILNADIYADNIGFQREALNTKAKQDVGNEFFDAFKDWKIAKPVQVEKGKPSIVTLQNPTTGEFKKFELTGDLNYRSLNPGNVGTTLGKITTGPVGKTLDEVFNWSADKTILSKTKHPIRILQKSTDTKLTEVANSAKPYLDKTVYEFVQTYLPQWVETKTGTLKEENPNQASYYNKLKSNIKLKFNVDLPKWKNAKESNITLRDLFEKDGQIDTNKVIEFQKFLMQAEGGGLNKVKELK